MPLPTPSAAGPARNRPSFWLFLGCLAVLLLALFYRSFDPDLVLFSNDGPLAAISSEKASMPQAFTGVWEDLGWLGMAGISAAPNITGGVSWWLQPLGFSKFYAPLSLALLGVAAWLFGRVMKFSPVTCILLGLAATLNMNVFSNTCWGLATRALTLGSAFAAVAALHSARARRPIVKIILAGFCVGMMVMEGFDVGAIFSIYLAAFAFFLALNREKDSVGLRVGKGLGTAALLAICAGFIAAYTLNVLISTQIKGISGTSTAEGNTEERYQYATQWSLPKIEALRVIIPGVFGYRMTDPNEQAYEGSYWGSVGQSPGFPNTPGLPRHSGSGEYAGVLVVLLAFWAVFQSMREKNSPYTLFERRCIWFWTVMAFISLLLAFGRHTPVYRLFYALPYASTIRNPIKFMHPFHLALLILFAYGLQDIARRYLENAKEKTESLFSQMKAWWNTVKGFDKLWTFGCLAAIAFSVLGWLVFAASRKDIAVGLTKLGFPDLGLTESIVKFSSGEIGWYILFLVLSVAIVSAILSGGMAGRRAKIACFLLGFLMVVDLSRANSFWIVYERYKEKLATNAIIETLRDKPYEHRVTASIPVQAQQQFYQFYHLIWLQHHFQYYNIQAMDLAQIRSPPEELVKFEDSFRTVPLITRRWQLTNTRYLLTLREQMIDLLNRELDGNKGRFRIHTAFDISQDPKTGIVSTITNGTNLRFALIEFTGALPREKLYANWQLVQTNDAIKELTGPAFDPEKVVLVSDSIAPPKPENVALDAGTVETVSYKSRIRKLTADAKTPCILLVNDRIGDYWNCWVDGKPEKILRCNALMRGVYLNPGKHEIEFKYQPPNTFLQVSTAAIVLAALLSAFLVVDRLRAGPAPAEGEPGPAPAPEPAGKGAKKA